MAQFPKQKGSFSEKLKQWVDSQAIPAKDIAAKALAITKGYTAKLVDAITKLSPVSDLERRVGHWDAEDQEGGLAAHRFAKTIRAPIS